MKLSVIIPFVNEYPQIMFTIQSIAQSLLGRIDFEIMAIENWCKEVSEQVVDGKPRVRDKGGDAVKACSGKLNKWLRYYNYSDTLSHWQAKNLGVRESTGDILWFCDAHCVVSRDVVYDMFRHYCGNQEYLNGSLHPPVSYKILESRKLIYKLVSRPEIGELSYSFTGFRASEEPYEVSCMSTCGMMISREIYDKLGGWPRELGIYRGGEHFINFVLAVLGMKKHIYPNGVLFHHGEKRGYHWNYDNSVKNRMIANYMFGGRKWLEIMKNNTKGRKNVLQSIADNVIRTCGEHRNFIKGQQKLTIEEWLAKWEGNK